MEPIRADAIFARVLAAAAVVLVIAAVAIAVVTPSTSGRPTPELVASVADRVRIAAATASTGLWLVLAGTVIARLRRTTDRGTRTLLSIAASVVMIAAGAGTVASVLDYSGSFFVPVAYGRISAVTGATQTAVCAALLWWIRSEQQATEESSQTAAEPIDLQP